MLRSHATRIREALQAVSAEKRKNRPLGLPGHLPTPEGGFLARCWAGRSLHQPLFAGGAGQFLEQIRAEVFPDERILVEQSKAANLAPLRRFGVQAYRPGRRLEQLEELAKRGLCFGGCHGDVTPIVHPPGGFFRLLQNVIDLREADGYHSRHEQDSVNDIGHE